MSDINQPCPTICSACKGKCSDQLVLPAGCVLRPTIERVEAVLTPERIDKLHTEARRAWGDQVGSEPTVAERFARAISREVVAILAEPSAEAEFDILVDDEWVAGASGPRERAMAEAMHYAVQYAEDGQVTIFEVTRRQLSTPAASGIGETGDDHASD